MINNYLLANLKTLPLKDKVKKKIKQGYQSFEHIHLKISLDWLKIKQNCQLLMITVDNRIIGLSYVHNKKKCSTNQQK